MEQTTSISKYIASLDLHNRDNRMRDEITMRTDLLALSNVLRMPEPAPLGVHAPTA